MSRAKGTERPSRVISDSIYMIVEQYDGSFKVLLSTMEEQSIDGSGAIAGLTLKAAILYCEVAEPAEHGYRVLFEN